MSRWCSASTWLAAMEASQDASSVTMTPHLNTHSFFGSWESRNRLEARLGFALNLPEGDFSLTFNAFVFSRTANLS
jgi:hypothetical protein